MGDRRTESQWARVSFSIISSQVAAPPDRIIDDGDCGVEEKAQAVDSIHPIERAGSETALLFHFESTIEEFAVSEIAGSTSRVRAKRTAVGRSVHVLYVFFDSVCMAVFAYEIYRWIRSSRWVKIPTGTVIAYAFGQRPFSHAGGIGGAVSRWVLDIDIVWALSIIAIIFFAIRWLLDRNVAKKQVVDP